ncbi:hypothetical protein AB751O23_AD_00380 [Chlamydiales bacterium SCGC AB-751-O23]|jgi:hypothetical protein|nr:hypothetical protein AB751O23_AD_00380 [Chlamydiales bacterium SCGC AB-751-O23]
MEIIIDDIHVDLDLPKDDVTLQTVVEETEDYLFSVGKVAISLTYNDKKITESELTKLLKGTAKKSDKLQFSVLSINNYVLNHLEAVVPANENLKKRLLTFSEEILSSSRPTERKELVSEFTQFFDFWLNFQKLFPEETSKVKFGTYSFEDYFASLQKMLKEIVEAMEKNDFVLAADLIQYEVVIMLNELSPTVEKLKELVEKKEADAINDQNESQVETQAEGTEET